MFIHRYHRPWAVLAADAEAGSGETGDQDNSNTGAEATGEEQHEQPITEQAAEAESGAQATGQQAEEIPAILPKKDWRDREIDRKHAKLQNAEREKAELAAENQRLKELIEAQQRGGTQPAQQQEQTQQRQQAPSYDEAEVNRRAEAMATQQAQQREFEAQCTAVLDKGKEAYGEKEWGEALGTLQKLGGYDSDTLAGILATEDPSRVIFEMASNPDLYHELMDLTPAKRLAKMATMAAAPKPKKKVSEAPEAIATGETVQGTGGRGGTLRDDMSDDDWYRVRAAQKRKRWEARNGGRAA